MSTLRKFQQDPKHLLNQALGLFRSRQIKTIIVEGVCDKRFLSQWIPAGAPIRFDGFAGKPLVNNTYLNSQLKPYSAYDFLYFIADVDLDVITGDNLHTHSNYIYNAYCFEETRLHFNDLETYLINTNAFEKVLVNLDLDAKEAVLLRQKLIFASRVSGSLRAADVILKRENKLSRSILNGLEIRIFFEPKDMSCNETALYKALPNWSNYPEYVDELIAKAEEIKNLSPNDWSLSRGHDLTEMLSLHFKYRGKHVTPEQLELMLRLACELTIFETSPMGKQLTKLGTIIN